MPAVQPPKSAIEAAIAALLMSFAGVGGAALDVDLALPRQQLKSVSAGWLLLQQQRKSGAAAGVKVTRMVKTVEENGWGSGGRSALYDVTLRIDGISQYSPVFATTIADRDLLDATIHLRLMRAGVDSIAPYLSGGKIEQVVSIDHVETDYLEDVDSNSGKSEFLAIFQQTWKIQLFLITGP